MYVAIDRISTFQENLLQDLQDMYISKKINVQNVASYKNTGTCTYSYTMAN